MRGIDIVKLGTSILFAKIMNRRIPFNVQVRVIEQCNQRCSYCLGDYLRRNIKPPTTEQLFEVVDGLARLGSRRITLSGGEPFLRDDIHDIVRRIKSHKINCSLTTNGRLIDRHKKMLKDLDLLSISLDGNKSAHDTYRGEGSYGAAIHAIEVAHNIGVPVQLICTVTRLIDPKLETLFKFANRYNCSVNFEQLNPLFNSDGTVTIRPEDMGEKGFNTLLDYQLKHKDSRLVHSQHVLKYVRNWPVSYNVFRLFQKQIPAGFKPIKCYAGRFSAFIETNGDLLPCCFMRPDYRSVNVFELGVETAWKLMPKNDCATCRSIGSNMFNALFALQPNTLLHFLNMEIKSRLNGKYQGV